MARETDLLYALLGLREGFLTVEKLLRIESLWEEDRSKSLREVLEKEGLCDAGQLKTLDSLLRSGEQSGASLVSDLLDGEDFSDSGLLLPDGEDLSRETMDISPEADSDSTTRVTVPGTPEGDRFKPVREIGKGGLGRVLLAMDVVLGREVAVKEMIRGTDNEGLLRRFLREGEVAGRLLHPNIVPVFDVGVRAGPAAKVPYFAMGRIRGRDLSEILHGKPDAEGNVAERPSLPRLLAIFQDVCQAIAYAHDHDVIHRDLKPANVMVGDYGEVYVVDWGLAKMKGQEDEPVSVQAGDEVLEDESDSKSTALTTVGDVIGTPSYMPPEQAHGRIDEVDERSDIYSLGAILYEILTLRPPYTGQNKLNILAQVMKEDLLPPSERVSDIRVTAGFADTEDTILAADIDPAKHEVEVIDITEVPEDVPPELEEIVLKAMAREKEDRYGRVSELHDEIQRYLEGEKEKERNRENAARKIQEGRELVEVLGRLRSEHTALSAAVTAEANKVQTHWPVEKKRKLWGLQKKRTQVQDRIVQTFSQAGRNFQSAFEFEPGNPEARAALADMYWDQYLREEERGARGEMILYENLVREYNDGQYDDLLRGDGTLAVTSSAYPCACLREGRRVQPDELVATDYHPFSGRSLVGFELGGAQEQLEPTSPLHLKIHSTDCRTEEVKGADVWIFRYEEKDRMLVPGMPDSPDGPSGLSDSPDSQTPDSPDSGLSPGMPPDEVLDALFEADSPFRPEKGLYLGKTPVGPLRIPMGSYLLIVAHEEYRPVLAPVQIARLAEEKVGATFFRPEEIPDGYLQVGRGRFIYGGDQDARGQIPAQDFEIDDFFMARFQVTCAEYAGFLSDLARDDPEVAAARVPRGSEEAGYYWPKDREGKYAVPTAAWLEAADEETKEGASRLLLAPVDWEEDWPVLGVSWEDGMHYAAWQSTQQSRLFSFPHMAEWEKAARGTDGRLYPWGNRDDPTFCNMNSTHEKGMRPLPVSSMPVDTSPYGIRGLSGNAIDPTLTHLVGHPSWRYFCGGAWGSSAGAIRATYRLGITTVAVYPPRVSIRLIWLPKLKKPPEDGENLEGWSGDAGGSSLPR
jgi:serine/threonine protein kinase/formylglycine-generating enzyme required for sulfatase activity